MSMGLPIMPPSRVNKKQIMAHLAPELVEAAHKRCAKKQLSLQEIIAEAINATVAQYGRTPFLKVGRERLVQRKKSPAKIQKLESGVRDGKRRIGAWFDRDDVEKVKDLAKQFGLRVEGLVERGLRIVLAEELAKATAKTTAKKPSVAEQQAKDEWDWKSVKAATPPSIPKAPRRAKTTVAA